MFKKISLGAIRTYQIISSLFFKKNCRFYPSCSEYASESIKKYGTFKGFLKGARRILKCHPFNAGGVDLP